MNIKTAKEWLQEKGFSQYPDGAWCIQGDMIEGDAWPGLMQEYAEYFNRMKKVVVINKPFFK